MLHGRYNKQPRPEVFQRSPNANARPDPVALLRGTGLTHAPLLHLAYRHSVVVLRSLYVGLCRLMNVHRTSDIPATPMTSLHPDAWPANIPAILLLTGSGIDASVLTSFPCTWHTCNILAACRQRTMSKTASAALAPGRAIRMSHPLSARTALRALLLHPVLQCTDRPKHAVVKEEAVEWRVRGFTADHLKHLAVLASSRSHGNRAVEHESG